MKLAEYSIARLLYDNVACGQKEFIMRMSRSTDLMKVHRLFSYISRVDMAVRKVQNKSIFILENRVLGII